MRKAFVDWLLSKVHLHKRDRFTNHLKFIIPAHQLSMQYIVVCKAKSAQKVLSELLYTRCKCLIYSFASSILQCCNSNKVMTVSKILFV